MPEEMTTEFNPDLLQDMLPIYYKRLFPHKQFYRWLSYNLCEFNKNIISRQKYINNNFISIFSWRRNIFATWILIHSPWWRLSPISVVWHSIWVGERNLLSMSRKNRYWCSYVSSSKKSSLEYKCHSTSTWACVRYRFDWLWWSQNMLFSG